MKIGKVANDSEVDEFDIEVEVEIETGVDVETGADNETGVDVSVELEITTEIGIDTEVVPRLDGFVVVDRSPETGTIGAKRAEKIMA